MGLVFREIYHSITFILLALWFTFLVFRFICFGLCDMLNSCVSLVCGAFKAPYTYVSQTLKKPPDPRSIVKQWAVKLLVKVILCLIAVITRAQVIDILVQDSIYYCTFKYACDKLLQKQRS